jgi:hypothetical protein
VSIDDLFTAGLGFDFAGAMLLGSGLLLSPGGVARRSGTYWDFNATEAVSLARGRFDAMVGFISLMLGFGSQVVAYAVVVGGVGTTLDGWTAALVAATAAIIAAILIVGIWRIAREPAVRRLLVEVAHYDAAGLRRQKWPSGTRLMQYGFALGEALTSDEVGPGETRRFVQRVFGVDYAVVDDAFQDDDVPPPEAFGDD